MSSKCNESIWSIHASFMHCIFFGKVNMMIWITYWVLLGMSKPNFVSYCFYISLRWNIFATFWYCQFVFWYCYVLFGQNIEVKYCVGIDWQPKKVIPRISAENRLSGFRFAILDFVFQLLLVSMCPVSGFYVLISKDGLPGL